MGCITSSVNATSTSCECNHLTNFAILISRHRPVSIEHAEYIKSSILNIYFWEFTG